MEVIKFKNDRLFYLDQTKLPFKEVWRECKNLKDAFLALRELRVRGAPLIGVFSAYAIAIATKDFSNNKKVFIKQLKKAINFLSLSRPTAVNLFWALERIDKLVDQYKEKEVSYLRDIIIKEAKTIHREDKKLSEDIAKYGLSLIKRGDKILTHCNTGYLATSGEGTALAILYKAFKVYKDIEVYIDETRPMLQGARLTAWELLKEKIPCKLICDNTAAFLMQKGIIDKVFVGADRIASNGDTANKIGTYNLAVLCSYHKIPFYVVAPSSSFDLKIDSGKYIPIEERSPQEVKKVLNKFYIAPRKVKVFNPAFDITPCNLISAIITECGIIYPPYRINIKKFLKNDIYNQKRI